MLADWPLVCLEEVAARDRKGFAMGPFGSNIRSENYQLRGIPVLRGVNLGNDRSIDGELVYLSEAKAEELKNSQAFPGDLLFVAQGTVGKVGLVPDNSRFQKTVLSQNLMKFSCDRSKCDPRFLYYYFISADGQHTISSRVNPTGVPCISQPLTSLKKFEVPLPPLPEQKAIAAVLGALDDKIELNRRTNATLEAIARALFQSWFIDFDPVRAKLDGRQLTGLDPATAALFPNEFEDSELGPIPKGWRVCPLGDVVELAYGKALKADDRREGTVGVYGSNGLVGWHDKSLVRGPGIVVGRKGNPGVVTWVHADFFPIDTTFYVVPMERCRSFYFLNYALRAHDLPNLSADSAVPGLNRNHAYMSQQLVPPPDVLCAFDDRVAPLFALIHINEQQSSLLSAIRDVLLPKLLTGELRPRRLPDAQKC